MELRYLRYFVAVAELKSFTRASEVMHVAQPAISQQIKILENELAVTLLRRTKRSVELTTAGLTFLNDARDILARTQTSRTNAQRAARGEIGTLSIGCFSTATFLFLPELIQAYRSRFPDVRVHLHEMTPTQQIEALDTGAIDIGFTRSLPAAREKDFFQMRIYRDRIMTVLPKRHPLARLKKIPLKQLAQNDWVFFHRSQGPELVDEFHRLCERAGFVPRVVSEPMMMQTVLMQVAAGTGVALTPNCMSNFPQPGVNFLPIHPTPPPLDLLAVRHQAEPSPTVAAFFDLLRAQLPKIQTVY